MNSIIIFLLILQFFCFTSIYSTWVPGGWYNANGDQITESTAPIFGQQLVYIHDHNSPPITGQILPYLHEQNSPYGTYAIHQIRKRSPITRFDIGETYARHIGGGAITGAATGTAMGIPGLGTIGGAVLGAHIGAITGSAELVCQGMKEKYINNRRRRHTKANNFAKNKCQFLADAFTKLDINGDNVLEKSELEMAAMNGEEFDPKWIYVFEDKNGNGVFEREEVYDNNCD